MTEDKIKKAAEQYLDNLKIVSKNEFESIPLAFISGAKFIQEQDNWISITENPQIPEELIDTDVDVWMCIDEYVFRGHFYKAYGGLNYKRSDAIDLFDNPPRINAIDKASKLTAYMLITLPNPPQNK